MTILSKWVTLYVLKQTFHSGVISWRSLPFHVVLLNPINNPFLQTFRRLRKLLGTIKILSTLKKCSHFAIFSNLRLLEESVVNIKKKEENLRSFGSNLVKYVINTAWVHLCTSGILKRGKLSRYIQYAFQRRNQLGSEKKKIYIILHKICLGYTLMLTEKFVLIYVGTEA